MASSFAGSGWNQIILPAELRIIGPFWSGPYWGVTKMSPGYAEDELRLTVIEAGNRLGCVWKCWTPLEPAGTIGSFIGLIVPNGVAIPKWNVPLVPPNTSSPVVTVTVSPAVNGWLGDEAPALAVGVGVDHAAVRAAARPDDGDVPDLARPGSPGT